MVPRIQTRHVLCQRRYSTRCRPTAALCVAAPLSSLVDLLRLRSLKVGCPLPRSASSSSVLRWCAATVPSLRPLAVVADRRRRRHHHVVVVVVVVVVIVVVVVATRRRRFVVVVVIVVVTITSLSSSSSLRRRGRRHRRRRHRRRRSRRR
jgi:hypothetical protein